MVTKKEDNNKEEKIKFNSSRVSELFAFFIIVTTLVILSGGGNLTRYGASFHVLAMMASIVSSK